MATTKRRHNFTLTRSRGEPTRLDDRYQEWQREQGRRLALLLSLMASKMLTPVRTDRT
jgi:hypothetical protein